VVTPMTMIQETPAVVDMERVVVMTMVPVTPVAEESLVAVVMTMVAVTPAVVVMVAPVQVVGTNTEVQVTPVAVDMVVESPVVVVMTMVAVTPAVADMVVLISMVAQDKLGMTMVQETREAVVVVMVLVDKMIPVVVMDQEVRERKVHLGMTTIPEIPVAVDMVVQAEDPEINMDLQVEAEELEVVETMVHQITEPGIKS